MIPRAHALGMKVAAWSRGLTPARAAELGVQYQPTPVDVARASDVLSVHLALTPETRGLIDAQVLSALRPGACFINTARSELVDQAALLQAMHERDIRVGLDVYASEPATGSGAFTDPLAGEQNLYGTHHIGASTEQAQEAIAAETVRVIRTFKETGKVPNCVNLARRTPATHRLVVRHRDEPGVLAQVLDAIREAKLNVQEMENVVFEGAQAAVAHINLDAAPPAEMLTSLRAGNPAIFDLTVLEL